MPHAKVNPAANKVNEKDAEILSSTSIDKQDDRLKVFSRRFEEYPDASVVDVFKSGMRVSASRPCLGTRFDINSPFTWMSYQEVFTEALNIGAFLAAVLKLPPESFVGIYTKNRAEWVILELGCYLYCLTPVPLYDTLGPEATDHILMQTRISVILCETPQHVTNLLRLKNSAQILHIIQLSGRIPKVNEIKQQAWGWQEALKAGRENPVEQRQQPNRKSLALLCYTSGTTGLPKGVQITHGNLIAESLAMTDLLITHGKQYVSTASCDDVYLSYLPLAHIFERIMHVLCFMHGMRIGFYRGDILTLVDDMKELKPTIFCTVPRLLNRIYDKTLAQANSNCLGAAIFRMALRRKTNEVNRRVIRKNSIWDSLVFSKIQASTGNRIRLVIVGSAPLAEKVMRFSRAAFGCPVVEGYGQTETTGGSTVTLPGNPQTGNVGMPLFNNVVQLQDVPEMGYYAKDGSGEVCIKGLNVTLGYFQMEAETAKIMDSDGWMHTGDIGQWTATIIDRKKHIFKLSQGEYVAPEKIEQIYSTNVYVYQVFVHGDSLENFILAAVVPNPEAVMAWAKKRRKPENLKDLCNDLELKTEILQSMQATGKANDLKSFEQVRDIHLHHEPFSVENGLLTPTFKAMRNELRRLFGETFTKMYRDHR
uniref:Long-chain-fatty-acid--CoA ligase n=1 Tax=Macrostomum lignano TaxID=282301 RepID=A0A1I8JJY1_9PLAT